MAGRRWRRVAGGRANGGSIGSARVMIPREKRGGKGRVLSSGVRGGGPGPRPGRPRVGRAASSIHYH